MSQIKELPVTHGVCKQLREHLQSVRQELLGAERAIRQGAVMLVADFRAERQALFDDTNAIRRRQALDAATRPPDSLYSPLQLFQRYRKGTLEIYWRVVHRVQAESSEPASLKANAHKITVYGDLRRVKNGDYHAGLLRKFALDEDRDLILAAEISARRLRSQWAALAPLRRKLEILEHAAIDPEQRPFDLRYFRLSSAAQVDAAVSEPSKDPDLMPLAPHRERETDAAL